MLVGPRHFRLTSMTAPIAFRAGAVAGWERLHPLETPPFTAHPERTLFDLAATFAVRHGFSNMPLLRSKAEHLVLAGPFGWQVGEASNSHPMREPPFDGGRDEIGREEGKRDCHIHLADAAPLALGDAVRGCRFLGDKFIEPTTPAGDRCDQGGAIFRTYRPGVLRRHFIRDKNRTAPP